MVTTLKRSSASCPPASMSARCRSARYVERGRAAGPAGRARPRRAPVADWPMYGNDRMRRLHDRGGRPHDRGLDGRRRRAARSRSPSRPCSRPSTRSRSSIPRPARRARSSSTSSRSGGGRASAATGSARSRWSRSTTTTSSARRRTCSAASTSACSFRCGARTSAVWDWTGGSTAPTRPAPGAATPSTSSATTTSGLTVVTWGALQRLTWTLLGSLLRRVLVPRQHRLPRREREDAGGVRPRGARGRPPRS